LPRAAVAEAWDSQAFAAVARAGNSRSYRCQVALAIVLEHVVFAGHVKHRHRQLRQHVLQRIELGRLGQLALGNNRGVIRVFGSDDASARI
jgi:hypothetical protein